MKSQEFPPKNPQGLISHRHLSVFFFVQEPVFLVEITCPQEAMSGVYNCMNLRRGCVFEENQREGTPLVQAGKDGR